MFARLISLFSECRSLREKKRFKEPRAWRLSYNKDIFFSFALMSFEYWCLLKATLEFKGTDSPK